MTVIAWDGESLAADSLVTYGSERSGYVSDKIMQGRDGTLLAICGELAPALALRLWWQEGAELDDYPSQSVPDDSEGALLVIDTNAETLLEYCSSPTPVRYTLEDPQAWGTGRGYALGAMCEGASAARAAEIACAYAIDCGGPIRVLRPSRPGGDGRLQAV